MPVSKKRKGKPSKQRSHKGKQVGVDSLKKMTDEEVQARFDEVEKELPRAPNAQRQAVLDQYVLLRKTLKSRGLIAADDG